MGKGKGKGKGNGKGRGKLNRLKVSGRKMGSVLVECI